VGIRVIDKVLGLVYKAEGGEELLAGVGVRDRGLVEDDVSAVVAVLPDKAVASVLQLLGTFIQTWRGSACYQLTAVQIPVMEQLTLLQSTVVLEEVASLLDLTDLLTQGHCVLYVRDVVALNNLVLRWITFPDGEVIAVIRNVSGKAECRGKWEY